VRNTLILSESGEEYTGQAQLDFLDANWNVVFSATSDVKGKRLETPVKIVAQPVENNQPVVITEVKVWPTGQSQYGAVPLLSISFSRSDPQISDGRDRPASVRRDGNLGHRTAVAFERAEALAAYRFDPLIHNRRRDRGLQ
jgi:hypothetical protein